MNTITVRTRTNALGQTGWEAVQFHGSGIVETITCGLMSTSAEVVAVVKRMHSARMIPGESVRIVVKQEEVI